MMAHWPDPESTTAGTDLLYGPGPTDAAASFRVRVAGKNRGEAWVTLTTEEAGASILALDADAVTLALGSVPPVQPPACDTGACGHDAGDRSAGGAR